LRICGIKEQGISPARNRDFHDGISASRVL
jgi:hypothetical protein